MDNIIFKETQRYNQWWLQILLVISNLAFIYNLYANNQLLTHGWTLALPVLITLLIYIIRLEFIISTNNIIYRFYPFQIQFKKIEKTEISTIFIRKYNPIFEYGGWGFRTLLRSENGALNIWGNMGIQLVLKNGNRLLIGTQSPNDAEEAVDEFWNQSDDN